MDFQLSLFFYTAVLKVLDTCIVVGVWYAVWYLRFESALFPITKGPASFKVYAEVAYPLAAVFLIVFHIVGAYRRDRIRFSFRAIKKVVQGTLLGTLVFIAICYFLRDLNFSRMFLGLFPLMVVPSILLERGLMEVVWCFAQKELVNPVRTLVLGSGDLLTLYLEKISERRPYPIRWTGRLGQSQATGVLAGIPFLGPEAALGSVLAENKVDRVIVSYPADQANQYAQTLEVLSNELAEVKVIPDFGKYSTFTYRSEDECGVPLLLFNQGPVSATDRALKRLLDIVGAFCLLVFFAPLFGSIAILMKLTSPGPIVYRQRRVGADGRSFWLLKFRSMRQNAEQESGAVWASLEDPRTTQLGKWLRRTSLDEIPQFLNVLKGDMSLVGPRPERPEFVGQFKKEIPRYMLRHKMKSGITGWAQVNGWRGNTELEPRVKHDLFYILHWSHYFDLKILCLTAWKGFVHKNAY